ncbi:hypothetical protein [Calothrix sp. NIES-2098]|uniref:hypothetical protein n=1 Tax=Calothrix sp. NIES-2098 TaxID=1954171 RepID=UPI000B605751|nr:hypothetical protein NIES2098_25420 [Calothrix sp. NIES-2098]
MANFCTRLVTRTLGLEPTVQPLIASMFTPTDAIAIDSADNSAVDPPQANLISPDAETLSTVTPLADAPQSLLFPSRADVLPLATPPPLVETPQILGSSSPVEQPEATGGESVNFTFDFQPVNVTPTPNFSNTLQPNSPAEISIQKSDATGGENVNFTSAVQPIPVTPTPNSSNTLQPNSLAEISIQKSEATGGENVNFPSDVHPVPVIPTPNFSNTLQPNSPAEISIQKSEATGGENVNFPSDVHPVPVIPTPNFSNTLRPNSPAEISIQKSEAPGGENVNFTSDVQPVPVIPTPNSSNTLQTKSPSERLIQKSKAIGEENVNFTSDVQPAPITPAPNSSQTLQTNNTTKPQVPGFMGSQVENNTLEISKSTTQNVISTSSSEQPKLTETPQVSGSIQPVIEATTGLASGQSTNIQDVAANVLSTRKVVESVISIPTPTDGVEKNADKVNIETSANPQQKSELPTGKEERREGLKNSPLIQSQLTPAISPQAQIPVSDSSFEVDKTTTANSQSIYASDSRHSITRRLSQRFLGARSQVLSNQGMNNRQQIDFTFAGEDKITPQIRNARSHSDLFSTDKTAISPINEKAREQGVGGRGENTIVDTVAISAVAAKVPALKSGYKEQPLSAERRQTVASSPAPTPTINITIGRIEVRGVNPPTPTPSTKSVRRSPALSLDNYLQQRNGSQR